jgi:hypothetical protein
MLGRKGAIRVDILDGDLWKKGVSGDLAEGGLDRGAPKAPLRLEGLYQVYAQVGSLIGHQR